MRTIIKNGLIVNEGRVFKGSVIIEKDRISEIIEGNFDLNKQENAQIINAKGKYLLPGVIDDQVHFREPGLTHKAEIYTESKAAVAGGITSFMEMPNTNPQTTTIDKLNEKFQIASQKSLANYSFYLGATNDNLDEIMKINPQKVCGLKVFMGSSTGNMLVDKPESLNAIFKNSPVLIATHCEDETIIKQNTALFKEKYGEQMPIRYHAEIRNDVACYKSSSLAVNLAKKHNARLHVLHLSSAKEMELFSNDIPAREKKITAEVCVHHLWFSDTDYETYGTKIKWNPAVKSELDKNALFQAMLDDKLDVIATDHAPHTLDEKNNNYFKAPSGGPLVQHSLLMMLQHVENNKISIEKVVDKMCHKPAEIFKIKERGFLKPGFKADLVLVNKQEQKVKKEDILYKCGWSPLEGTTLNYIIEKTFINGHLVYDKGKFFEELKGEALEFER